MVDLQTRQSNIGAAIQTMENIIYKQRAQIEELERALLLKGNKATFENHLKLKADNAMVEQLFERNMKYSLQLSKKYNVTHDDIAKAVSNKVGTEAVETLAKEVDDIRSSLWPQHAARHSAVSQWGRCVGVGEWRGWCQCIAAILMIAFQSYK